MGQEKDRSAEGQSRRDVTRMRLWHITPIRDLGWVLGAFLVLLFAYKLRSVLMPVLVAFLLAYICQPLVLAAQEYLRIPRLATTLVLLLVAVTTGATFVAWFGPQLVGQLTDLVRNLPGYVQTLAQRYEIGAGDLTEDLQRIASRYQEDPEAALAAVWTGTGRVFGFFGQAVGVTTWIVVTLGLIAFYFIFFCWRFHKLDRVEQFIPADRRERAMEIIRKIDGAFGGFFRGRVIIAVIFATMLSVGWGLVGVPYWFVLSVLCGILSLAPYAAVIGWLAALLLKYVDAAATGGALDWVDVLIWPSVVYAVVQVIEGWLLTPWIQSHALELSPVTIMIALLIGAAFAGFFGLLLAVPVAATIKILIIELVVPRIRRWAANAEET